MENRAPETRRPKAWPPPRSEQPVEPEASTAARRRTAASHDQRQETERQDTPAHSSAASPSGRIGHTAKDYVEPSRTPLQPTELLLQRPIQLTLTDRPPTRCPRPILVQLTFDFVVVPPAIPAHRHPQAAIVTRRHQLTMLASVTHLSVLLTTAAAESQHRLCTHRQPHGPQPTDTS